MRGPRDSVDKYRIEPKTPTLERQEEEGGRKSIKQTEEKYSEFYREHQEKMVPLGKEMAEKNKDKAQDE